MLGDQPQHALTNRYSKVRSRSHHVVIRVYDGTGNVIETLKYRAISILKRQLDITNNG